MERDPQNARERAVLLLRAALFPGRYPTPGQWLMWATRGAFALGVPVLLIYIVQSIVHKSLWGWLNLLIVPLVLAIVGLVFTHSQNRATQAAEERRTQDDALQAYLDRIGQLVIDQDLPNARDTNNLRSLARAWTLTILPRLNGLRKRTVVQFLYESRLICNDTTVIALTGAHLATADLLEASLKEANLHGAYLARARLMRAELSGADLGDAKLFGADLRAAKLDRANLRGTDLMSVGHGTPLPGASLAYLTRPKGKLIDAGPKNADLSGADLSGADLTDAYLSEEQLNSAESREGATMPNGQKYEDWLKSRGEDGGSS